jgi:hypothetical protein
MNLFVKSCRRQRAYPEGEAKRLVRLLPRPQPHAYQCSACRRWHIRPIGGRHSQRQ